MSAKITFSIVAALVVGGVVSNLDRMDFGGDYWQKTSPEVTGQKELETAVLAFSTAIQNTLPPRNKALEAHRAIEKKCSLPFLKPHDIKRLLGHAYRYNTAVLNCLETAENAAVSSGITYDYDFAKETAATLRYNIERGR